MKAELEQAKIAIEQARRVGDLARMSELQYGKIPELEKQLDTTEFCVSCHSMQPVYQEYKQSVHFQNASGVRAECHDCHIPPD
ncbi:NapC/NirT family cytochrome c, partial [Salmonella enterica subsp. enterica serovar Anatum]|nr:NapC/NirT family cytochrome c [Salmonella enterica subsp. enterica serovar Anatum]